MNERITEDIVREILKKNKEKYNKITLEEQKSDNPRLEKYLKNASKQGDGMGKPEFIITFDEYPDLVIIIECKADLKKHVSRERNMPKDFAVDGVLHYSEYLAREFDVISIAVSGEKKSYIVILNSLLLRISCVVLPSSLKDAKNIRFCRTYAASLHDFSPSLMLNFSPSFIISSILIGKKE